MWLRLSSRFVRRRLALVALGTPPHLFKHGLATIRDNGAYKRIVTNTTLTSGKP